MEHVPRYRWFTRIILLFLATTLVSVLALAAISVAFLLNLRTQNRWEEAQASAQRILQVLDQTQADDAELNASLYKEFNFSRQLGLLTSQGVGAYLGYRLESIATDSAGPGVPVHQFFSNYIDGHPGLSRIVVRSLPLGQWHEFLPLRKSRFLEEGQPDDARILANETKPFRQLDLTQATVLEVLDESGRGLRVSVHGFREFPDEGLVALVYLEFDLAKVLAAAGIPGPSGDRVILVANGQTVLDTGGPRKGDPRLVPELLAPGLKSIDLNGPWMVQHLRLDTPLADLVVLHPLGPLPVELGLVLALALALVMLGCGVSVAAIRYYSLRLRELLKGIESLRKGNLGVRIPLGSQTDELTFIATSFNTMVADLERHVDRVYVAEVEQAKAESLAYQSQVNPHFLFNTLEAIRMRALVHGAEDVSEMIFILSSMFRRMVKEGLFISLEDEIRHCRLYLDLFRIRYPGQLSYEIRVDPSLAGAQVLKFILQPVVENTIIHGFSPTRDDHHVLVNVVADGPRIRFMVEDNGPGITPARLAEVRAVLDLGASSPGSVGLSNLQARLRVNYGKEFLVLVSGEPGRGCRVSFEIPHRSA